VFIYKSNCGHSGVSEMTA